MSAKVSIPDTVSLTAVERARAFGIDVTLLLENLRLTPEQRLEKAQRSLASMAALRAEADGQRPRARATG
jgi:hypothetical protein